METSEILIGNICSLCAMITDGISGTRKNPRHILGAQLISQFFYGAGSFVLKGYSSTVQNIVSVLRNLAAMKNVSQPRILSTIRNPSQDCPRFGNRVFKTVLDKGYTLLP